jgi:hypothetical protein
MKKIGVVSALVGRRIPNSRSPNVALLKRNRSSKTYAAISDEITMTTADAADTNKLFRRKGKMGLVCSAVR